MSNIKVHDNKIVFLLLIVCVIVIGLNSVAHAEFVLAGLSLKAFALILGSMGLLAVGVQNSTLPKLLDDYSQFASDEYGISAKSVLTSMAINSIKNNTKMKYQSLKESIVRFFETTIVPDNPVGAWSSAYSISYKDIDKNAVQVPTPSGSIRGMVVAEIFLGELNGDLYHLKTFAEDSFGNSSGTYVTKNNIPVPKAFKFKTSTGVESYRDYATYSGFRDDPTAIYSSPYPNFKVTESLTVSDKGYSYNYTGIDSVNDGSKSDESYPFLGLYDNGLNILEALEGIEPVELEVKDVEEVAFPVSWLPDYLDSIGGTLDDIVGRLDSLPLNPWIEKVGSTDVNVLNPDVVKTDVNDIVTAIEVSANPTITTGIDSVIGAIKSIFIVDDSLTVDFSPIKSVSFADRFPFCLPADIGKAVNFLVAPPEAPVWVFPFENTELVLDFNKFESLAMISRSFFTLLFLVAVIFIYMRFL